MEQGSLDENGKRAAVDDDDQEKRVYDSSIDHKGRIPLRSTTGAWRASLFVIAIEFSERLSYFGIATNLIIYLTKVLHQDLKTAAKSTNNWAGVTTVMPLVGGFLADAYFGRSLIGVTLIVYVQDHVSWAAADIILTTVMAMSIAVFLIGRPFYRYRAAKGSPLTPMLQVLVAAIRNRKLRLPSDPSLLYEVPNYLDKAQGRLLCHTDRLR
ncbi:hypothetical protein Syun_000441 [Stephania yunnanensis]|uniref:Peptide transporter n=1 Tax=Stephania yunnanensis TaxID=152371 RepID=A0AAP0LC86_9MAGN